MVKNYGGGDKMKHLARKHVNGSKNGQSSKIVRTASCDDEKYGYVIKILGNSMCMVKCFDGYERLCYIRGKFTGRSKRENTLVAGTWVLVGLRQWDAEKEFASKLTKTNKNIQKCDLLEIYTLAEREKLRAQEKVFQSIEDENSDDEFMLSKQSVEFKDQSTLEYHEIVEQGGTLSRLKKSSYLDLYDNISSSSCDENSDGAGDHHDDDGEGDGDVKEYEVGSTIDKSINITTFQQNNSPKIEKRRYDFQNDEIDIDDI